MTTEFSSPIINDDHKEIKRELEEMCQLITGRPSTLCFFAGSSVEIPDPPTCCAHSDLGIKRSEDDVDMMYYSTNIYAFNESRRVSKSFKGEIRRIQKTIHPGYAKLVSNEQKFEQVMHATLIHLSFDDLNLLSFSNGPAVQTNLLEMFSNAFKALSTGLKYYFRVGKMEAVYAVHSPYWPDEASEWITRTRKYGFPSKDLIKRIATYGCDFVNVSPKCYHDQATNVSNEAMGRNVFWRYSFSMAEYVIINNWTPSQRIVYRVLRWIHKIMKSKNETKLCTYHFKTLMLWESERRPPEFWLSNIVQDSIDELLEKMKIWLKIRIYPNYFILENNLIIHLKDWEIEHTVKGLPKIIKKDIYFDVLERGIFRIYNEESNCRPKGHYQRELPRWLYRILIVLDYFLNSAIRIKTFNKSEISAKVHNVLEEELHDVCRGLIFQQKSTTRKTVEDVQQYIALANMHLVEATRLVESSTMCFINLSTEPQLTSGLIWLMKFIFKRDLTRHEYSSSFSCLKVLHPKFEARKNKWEQDPKTIQQLLKNSNLSKKKIADAVVARVYSVFIGCKMKTLYEGYVPNLPGFMPTVSLSWFFSKAYLANLIYTTDKTAHKFALVTQCCNEIMAVYKQSMLMHPFFADWMLPVSLSTKRAAVFDADIQNMLGFYSLCSFVRVKSIRDECRSFGDKYVSCDGIFPVRDQEAGRELRHPAVDKDICRDVHLGICSIQFSIYLKFRCACDQNLWSDLPELKRNWSGHKEKCTSDRNANNGRIVLLTILNIIEKN